MCYEILAYYVNVQTQKAFMYVYVFPQTICVMQ